MGKIQGFWEQLHKSPTFPQKNPTSSHNSSTFSQKQPYISAFSCTSKTHTKTCVNSNCHDIIQTPTRFCWQTSSTPPPLAEKAIVFHVFKKQILVACKVMVLIAGSCGRSIEHVQGDFIHSIRNIIEESKELSGIAFLPDGQGKCVVPFCRDLSHAPGKILQIHMYITCMQYMYTNLYAIPYSYVFLRYRCSYIYTYTYIYIYIYIHTHTYIVCICVCIYKYIYIYMCACVCERERERERVYKCVCNMCA